MIRLFHVERTSFMKLTLFLALAFTVFISCVTPRHTIDVSDFILLPNGKEVPGKQKGLTAFIFENDPRKIPFNQYIADKYNLGSYSEVEYWVPIEGQRFKIMLYENAELEKYFDVSSFAVSSVEPDINVVGSKAKFLAISVIDEYNEDCLSEGSLYQPMILSYLKKLKDEYKH